MPGRWYHRNAILSLYHLRPVPERADGRTQQERDEKGAPLPALWLDENRPGMYREAAELRQLGFKSRQTAEAILAKCKNLYPIILIAICCLASKHFANMIYAFNHILDLCFCISMLQNGLDAQALTFTTGLYNDDGDQQDDIGIMSK